MSFPGHENIPGVEYSARPHRLKSAFAIGVAVAAATVLTFRPVHIDVPPVADSVHDAQQDWQALKEALG